VIFTFFSHIFYYILTVMKQYLLFSAIFALSLAFAQEGAIKFQLSLDSTGMPIVAPPRPETPQKLGMTGNRPLICRSFPPKIPPVLTPTPTGARWCKIAYPPCKRKLRTQRREQPRKCRP